MSIFQEIRPLWAGEKIVDKNGVVMPTFALLWQQLFGNADYLDDEKANKSLVLTAGAGLTGGGDLSEDRTFNVGAGSGIAVSADAVALETLAPDPSGTFTNATVTIDAHGRVTDAESGSGGGSWIPLVDGSDPPVFLTNGAGVLALVAYGP